MAGKLVLVLLALGAPAAVPSNAYAGWMTKPKAEKYVRETTSYDFGGGGDLSGTRARCRVVGTALGGNNVYRCRFGARFTPFRYRGSARVYPFHVDGKPKPLYSFKYRWYRGSCGGLGVAYPFAIASYNLKCPKVRSWIWNWYHRGRPMPSAYDCELRSAPSTARCVAYGQQVRRFSFKYPE
jgi:hypothetical protein